MTITGDQKFLKHINRMALVRLIRSQPGQSRADLAAVTGLTKSTITLLAQELIDEGWLTEDEVLVTGSIGRRPTPLRLDTKRLALIGADLNTGYMEVVATTLTGDVITLVSRTFEDHEVHAVITLLARTIAEVAYRLIDQRRTILGVGLGVPGPVQASSGVLHFSPNLGWRDVPLRALLSEGLQREGLAQLQVFVQRRAASAALGEVEFSSTPAKEPLLYINL
ncbi:MAG TPA: ROK family protein, partial [Rhodocyclaceae bacterium]|nr:ROK family protein [Rhodocyclaceae bacterium]